MIPKDHVKKVCKPGSKDCCAYLTMGSKGWECGKLEPSIKKVVDERLKAGTMRATGDNCDGVDVPKRIIN